ncbi:hypothetical protein CRG98_044910 [Punica granatum]|uniref:Uncharacterized protein n=1 Tax=Punica granatum TaxID=22663 RepID=A0A2I0HSL7_PUNGR|nr:hypothetical protein CRG98_044910 [Punica granatum]
MARPSKRFCSLPLSFPSLRAHVTGGVSETNIKRVAGRPTNVGDGIVSAEQQWRFWVPKRGQVVDNGIISQKGFSPFGLKFLGKEKFKGRPCFSMKRWRVAMHGLPDLKE